MDENSERSSEPDETRESPTAAPEQKRRKPWWLVGALAVGAAVAGYYTSVRGPASYQRDVDLAVLEQANGREAVPPAQAEPAPPTGPLEFLSGLSKRPATVETVTEEAERVTQALVDAFPNEPSAHDMMARVHDRAGASQEATAAWEKSLELNSDYSHAYLGLASTAAARGENQKAVTLLRQALIAAPDSFDVQIQLAQALIDLNRLPEAIGLLESNVVSDPRPYRGHVLLGMAHLQLEEYEQAKTSYAAALASHPNHANACFGLATACARLGQQDLYEEHIARFGELRSGEREIAADQRRQFDDLGSMCASAAQIYTDAAKIFLTKGSSREAEILCRRAAVLDPKNSDCRQALAWMHAQVGQSAMAIQMFEELSRIDPGNLGYRLETARLQSEMGSLEAAEQTLRAVSTEAPENAAGYVALAKFLLEQKRSLSEVVELARTAVELDPSAAHQVLLSSAYEETGQLPQAIEAMARALELAPENLQYQQIYALLKEKK